MVTLVPLKKFVAPVMAASINPDLFDDKCLAEIAELPIYEGNAQKKLKDIFKIEQDSAGTPPARQL